MRKNQLVTVNNISRKIQKKYRKRIKTLATCIVKDIYKEAKKNKIPGRFYTYSNMDNK